MLLHLGRADVMPGRFIVATQNGLCFVVCCMLFYVFGSSCGGFGMAVAMLQTCSR